MWKRIALACLVASVAMVVTSALVDGQSSRKTNSRKSAKPKYLSEKELGERIDDEINKVLKRDRIKAAKRSNDQEFLRRVYFDTVGVPPTPEEVKVFVRDRDKYKRSKLIDRLVADPRFGRHLADQWTNVWVGRKRGGNESALFAIWLADQFNNNEGFDKTVFRIVTATGKPSENPAAVYYASNRTLTTPDIAGQASKHFTGVQIQCAQCHDHPYEDDWKVADFDGVASFFSRIQVKRNGRTRPNEGEVLDRGGKFNLEQTKKRLGKYDKDDKRYERLAKALKFSQPKFLMGNEANVSDMSLWRATWAAWVINKSNHQSHEYWVNRFWSFLMGSGLLNPVDDFNSFNEASHPELLQLLASDFRTSNFDVKRLYRSILKSETYQRSSKGADEDAQVWHFASYPVRQLTPEQFFAGLIQIASTAKRTRGVSNKVNNPYRRAITRAKADMAKAEKNKKKAEEDKNKRVYAYDIAAYEALADQYDKMTLDWYQRRAASQAFTRLTSDDEGTETDAFSLTIDQALLVMNGSLTSALSERNRGSVLDTLMKDYSDDDKRVERMFLLVLSRYPTKYELSRTVGWLDDFNDDANKVELLEDILFALMMTSEFANNH